MRVVVDNGPGKKRRAPATRRLKAAVPSHHVARGGRRRCAATARADRVAPGRGPSAAARARRARHPRVTLRRRGRASATGDRIVGCAELAPLSASVAEVRSLVVGRDARRVGLGQRMSTSSAAAPGATASTALCAFAHDPSVLRAPRLLDRAAHVGAREDRPRLPRRARCSATAASTPWCWTFTHAANHPLRTARGNLRGNLRGNPRQFPCLTSARSPAASPRRRASAPRAALRHQGQRQAGPGAAGQRCAGDRGRHLHAESRQGRAGARLEEHLATSGGRARALVTNSGCANACTGPQGMADAREMAALTADAVGCALEEALVASTGVIGVNLKMDALRAGIPQAVAALADDGGAAAARAIMTTDPFPKEAAVEVNTDVGTFRVGGMAKGSGMIEPRMATMLGYLTTDAAVAPVDAAARADRSVPLHLQRDHRRRRAVDQRLRVRAGQRRQRRRDRRGPVSGAGRGVPRRRPGARARHRARRRRRHQAGGDHRQRRRHRCRRLAGGPRDRQLAAGEDRHPRRRPELGPAGRGGRAARAPPSCSRARVCTSARWCCSRTAGRSTSGRRRPPTT